jgi:MoaA/NifB/PqqE/SkfB family radical SAM enzyme/esterase/lipase
MNRLAVFLVHGFSGCYSDFFPVADDLIEIFGRDSIHFMRLPNHDREKAVVAFDQEHLLTAISTRLEKLYGSVDTLVVVGHSTGGNLLLAALEQTSIVPDLLVLAATPFRIDLTYLERWTYHQKDQPKLSLTTISGLIKLINACSDRCEIPECPVLIIQGKQDNLVIPQEAQNWCKFFEGKADNIDLPNSDHQLFSGVDHKDISTALHQKIIEISESKERGNQRFFEKLSKVEPEVKQFFSKDKSQIRSLSMSPSGRRLQEKVVKLPEVVPWGPVFANIEITTFCNFGCRYCARTVLTSNNEMMSQKLYEELLDRLPSAYRVTLVGLGEPLLHPQLEEFITLAKVRGRRVGLVTNAQLLDKSRAAKILAAGLDSIIFSLDSVDPKRLFELRHGANLSEIEANIRSFCALSEESSSPISKAVFSAMSVDSLDGLEELINRVATLGPQVLMLSDLNFFYNQVDSLNSNINDERELKIRQAVTRGFSLGLPILGVRNLEDFGLAQRYRDALLLPVQQLYCRSKYHRYCFSPWQTISVNVSGDVCLCDCCSENRIGNLQQQKMEVLWNGHKMREHRRRMLSEHPPKECLICPRF